MHNWILIYIELIQAKCRQIRSEAIYELFSSMLIRLRFKIARKVAPKYVVISGVDDKIMGATAH